MTKNKLYLCAFAACIAGYAWIWYNYYTHISSTCTDKWNMSVCYFKTITSIPCPSCGTTRSVLSVLQGNIKNGIVINPLGLVMLGILSIVPLWIMYDIIRCRSSFYNFFQCMEFYFKKKTIAIPAIALVLCNWIWNIYKHL